MSVNKSDNIGLLKALEFRELKDLFSVAAPIKPFRKPRVSVVKLVKPLCRPRGQGLFIYGLKDPRNGAMRYVGRAGLVRLRYLQHLNGKSAGRKLTQWLTELKEAGLKPELVNLATCPITKDPRKLEFKIMNRFKGLLNTEGYFR